MKFIRAIALTIFAGLSIGPSAGLAAQRHHSMAEYAHLIGTWRCISHIPGRKALTYETTFGWKYPNHSVIDQYIGFTGGRANFMLSYVPKTDSFQGVFVQSDGTMGFWYNPGPHNGGWTEYGYDVANRAEPNTRAIFYAGTNKHYAFHFYAVKGKNDPGRLIDSEACDKVKA